MSSESNISTETQVKVTSAFAPGYVQPVSDSKLTWYESDREPAGNSSVTEPSPDRRVAAVEVETMDVGGIGVAGGAAGVAVGVGVIVANGEAPSSSPSVDAIHFSESVPSAVVHPTEVLFAMLVAVTRKA